MKKMTNKSWILASILILFLLVIAFSITVSAAGTSTPRQSFFDSILDFFRNIFSGGRLTGHAISPIGACGVLSTPDTIYTLSNPVSSTGTCFNVTANNVTIDCGSWSNSISYGSLTTGIYHGVFSNKNGTTVRNCQIMRGTTTITLDRRAVFFQNNYNGRIENSNLSLNRYGVYLLTSRGNVITNSILANSSLYGLYAFTNSTNNQITNNVLTGNPSGIYIQTSSDNIVSGNSIAATTNGVYAISSPRTTVSDNTLTSGTSKIYLTSSPNSEVSGNTLSGAGTYGIYAGVSSGTAINNNDITLGTSKIYLTSTNNTIVSGNTLSGAGTYGIYAGVNSGITITDNSITLGTNGIYLASSIGNRISGNSVTSTTNGIYLSSSSNNNLTGNTANNNTQRGLYIYSNSNNNIITANTANSNVQYGMHLSSSSDNVITDNVLSENKIFDFNIDAASGDNCSNTVQNNIASGGRPLGFYDSAVTLSDQTFSELVLCNADNSNLNNIIISGSDSLNNSGLLVVRTDYSTISNVYSSNNYRGIYLLSSTNNILTGNTAEHAANAGIFLAGSSENTLINNRVNLSFTGIFLSSSTNNSVTGNILSNISEVGISLSSSSNYNQVENNIVGLGSSPSAGIEVDSSNYNTLTGNDVLNPGWYTFWVLTGSTQNNIINNSIVGTYYLDRVTNNTLIGNRKGKLGIYSGSYNTAKNNNFDRGIYFTGGTGCSHTLEDNIGPGGLPILYSNIPGTIISDKILSQLILCNADNSTVTDVTAVGVLDSNSYPISRINGISLLHTEYATLSNVTSSNYEIALFLDTGSNYNTIKDSNFNSNYYSGIAPWNAIGNRIINNTLSGNGNSEDPSSDGTIYCFNGNNTLIAGNTIKDNNNNGLLFLSCSNSIITGNTISSNAISGMYMGTSYRSDLKNVSIYNNIFNNPVNIDPYSFSRPNISLSWNIPKTLGTNIVGGPYIGGNVWSNPSGTEFSDTCTDADEDGICDSAYDLAVNNTDYLPLKNVVQGCSDADGDGINTGGGACGAVDNCPNEFNPDQVDTDGDGKGDVCDICPGDPADSCNPLTDNAATIGSAGGTLTTGDGAAFVNIPAGALTSPTTITEITSRSNFQVSTSKGKGTAIVDYDLLPLGVVFNQPVTITFHYPQGSMKECDKTEKKIAIWYNDPSAGWTQVPSSTLNCTANTVTATVTHFSEYAVIAPLDADGDDYALDWEGITDCDDANETINPGAAEICNGVDDNCDGNIDEGCHVCGNGIVESGETCDDSDTTVPQTCGIGACERTVADTCINSGLANECTSVECNPGTPEAETCDDNSGYDGIDNNCDGTVDLNCGSYCDQDGDGYSPHLICALIGYSLGECDDNNAAVNPGATETCNNIDDNCNAEIDEGVKLTFYLDNDNDEYGDAVNSILACSAPNGYVANSGDCDDTNADVHPNAQEVCNSIDDNCNGEIDENVKQTFYRDSDGDNFGSSNLTVLACTIPLGYSTVDNDCNDNDPNVNPGADEICNGIDDNCNEEIDEGDICASVNYYCDSDNDGYLSSIVSGSCSTYNCIPSGCISSVGDDCDDYDNQVHPNALETCNNIDDNCNGQIDEGVQSIFYRDSDSDGYGNLNIPTEACSAPNGYVADSTDCDDSNANAHPNALETCNGIDDDCDGTIDEGVKSAFYRDFDSDGYGDAADSVQECSAPEGYVIDNTDCNDLIDNVYPGGAEICDALDNDCDIGTPDGSGESWYEQPTTCGVGACAGNTGIFTCEAGAQLNTCDPFAGTSPESCDDNSGYNGIDDNCDGTVDLDCGSYCDQDGDGYSPHWVCALAGYSLGDCDDGNVNIHPNANDIPCNGIDEDCSAGSFEGTDADSDGFKIEGGLCGSIDCDDSDAATYPGTTQTSSCAGTSSDCSGTQSRTCQASGEYSEWSICDYTSSNGNSCNDFNACTSDNTCESGACIGTEVICPAAGTCNDATGTIWTGACDPFTGCTSITAPAEMCNAIDDDCDGTADEEFPDLGETCTVDVGACAATGIIVCSEDGLSTRCNAVPGTPSPELCDASGIDEDCDGQVNEGCECNEGQTRNCGPSTDTGACEYGTQTCDINGQWGVCTGAVYPSAEICNGIDDDCNGNADEGLADIVTDIYGTDSIGVCRPQIESCTAGSWQIIQQAIGPSAEICDSKDNNCDGFIDNKDSDNDGFNDCNGLDKCVGLAVTPLAQFIKLNPNSVLLTTQIGRGCTCAEVLQFCKPGDELGQWKNGCSPGTVKNWKDKKGWASSCSIS